MYVDHSLNLIDMQIKYNRNTLWYRFYYYARWNGII